MLRSRRLLFAVFLSALVSSGCTKRIELQDIFGEEAFDSVIIVDDHSGESQTLIAYSEGADRLVQILANPART
jgi:hypothetical protein